MLVIILDAGVLWTDKISALPALRNLREAKASHIVYKGQSGLPHISLGTLVLSGGYCNNLRTGREDLAVGSHSTEPTFSAFASTLFVLFSNLNLFLMYNCFSFTSNE